jgi:NAD(P)-dependent dehydrogenase (short-subunit alcohol dehydrogenase family)
VRGVMLVTDDRRVPDLLGVDPLVLLVPAHLGQTAERDVVGIDQNLMLALAVPHPAAGVAGLVRITRAAGAGRASGCGHVTGRRHGPTMPASGNKSTRGGCVSAVRAGWVAVFLDVTDQGQVDAVASQIAGDAGGLDGVVNNAGVGTGGPRGGAGVPEPGDLARAGSPAVADCHAVACPRTG